MEKEIQFRALIEVLGKPKEHVDSALKGYIDKLEKDSKYEVVKKDFADLKKQDETEFWMAFAEVEVKTAKIEDITLFCFEYMPSSIEIVQPGELVLQAADISMTLNDLQARLHQVDMIAKNLRLENKGLQQSLGALLNNYILALLGSGKRFTSQQISDLSGVSVDKLEDFLDKLIDKGKIDLEGEQYYLKNEST